MGIKSLLNLRMTKIVCTIGPATSSDDQIRRLILAGMNVARLNFSHGSHDTHKKILRAIRRISEELGHEVGILQDLGGPKIRLGKLPVQELKLRTGEKIGLGPESSSDLSVMPVNYPFIVEDVAVGDRILLADGLVELEVVAKASKKVICRVVVGGVVHSQKGINLPASKLRVPAFTDKDREDLELGLKERVDFVALSFVRREQDLEPVQEIIKLSASRPLLIAKIEKAQAIERLE